MTERRALHLSRTIAIILLLVLVDKVALLRMAVGPLLGVNSSPELLVVVWLWLFAVVGTVVGLVLHRRWSAYLLLIAVSVSTVLLSVPLLPWITQLAPEHYRFYAMLVANVAVLFAALLLIRYHARHVHAVRPAG
jgi:hypothetical protein